MKLLLLLQFLVLTVLTAHAQVKVQLHARVDTTSAEVMEIVALFENFLSSEPDIQAKSNPYWNQGELKRYGSNYNLARKSLFQFPAKALLSYFTPLVLRVSQEKGGYAIQTAYINAEGLEKHRPQSPFAIHPLYAIQEGDEWKLANALDYRTQGWATRKVGHIRYRYSLAHTFNPKLARKAVRFCKANYKRFDLPVEPINFYICTSADELGWLLGFDFSFAGYTTGKVFYDERLLFCGFATEYYPHELAHLSLPESKNRFVNEGMATLFGGSKKEGFPTLALQFQEKFPVIDTTLAYEIFKKPNHPNAYALSAMLLDKVYREHGTKGLMQLVDLPKGEPQAYLEAVAKLLGADIPTILSRLNR